MRSILYTALFLALLAAAAFAALILMVSAKEGGETWQLAAGTAGFLVLGAVWWRLAGKFEGPYHRTLGFLGKGLLTLGLVLYGIVTTPYVLASLEGPRLEKQVAVENLQASWIAWPSLGGPVGVRLEMDLVHGFHKQGVLHPPQIWMGKYRKTDPLKTYFGFERHYFNADPKAKRDPRRIALLKTVLDSAPGPGEAVLKQEGRTHVAYDLYPGFITYLESQDKFCLDRYTFPINHVFEDPPVFSDGEALSGQWFFAGDANLTVDLSSPLTETLRRQAALKASPAEWRAMHRRFETQRLKRAGYNTCKRWEGDLDHRSGRVCFCRKRGSGKALETKRNVSPPAGRKEAAARFSAAGSAPAALSKELNE